MISIRGANIDSGRDIVDVASTRSDGGNEEIDLVLSLVIPPHRDTVSDE
jgi:hypothetical protein